MPAKMRIMTFSKSQYSTTHNLDNDDENYLFDYVGNASNLHDAASLLTHSSPEVAIIELCNNDNSYLSCIEEMLALQPNLKILVTSNHDELSLGIQALLHGATSLLRAPYSNEQLSKALKRTSADLLL